MKKEMITAAVITIAIMTTLLFPVSNTVTIIKSEVNENRPFAGIINGQVVGTDLCVKYWLERDKQPDTVQYRITKPFILGIIGFIYSYKHLKQ